MKRWLVPLGIFAACAVIAHVLVIRAAPGFIMGTALERMEERGIPLHEFVRAPRITPQTQTIVRPSPDLAYSLCRFDFAQAPRGIRVRMAPYSLYSSVSAFDADTDNFLTARGEGRAREFVLLPPGLDTTGDDLTAPTGTGVILIRRLVPREADHQAVQEIATADLCEAL